VAAGNPARGGLESLLWKSLSSGSDSWLPEGFDTMVVDFGV